MNSLFLAAVSSVPLNRTTSLAMAITLDKTKDGLYQLGQQERQEEIALNLLKEGLAEEMIIRVTGLTAKQIVTYLRHILAGNGKRAARLYLMNHFRG